jgi:uncharacterized RDD family membrane protein YckC
MSADVAPERDLRLQGHHAGIVSRLSAFVIDAFTIAFLFAVAGRVVEYLVSALSGDQFKLSDRPVISVVLFVAWAFFYCAYPLAVGGRTFGMAVVGLQAVRTDGRDLDGRHAVIRVLAFPLSFLLLGLGFVLIVLNRDRRALHDLIAGTAVIYAWDARAARLRFLAKRASD